MRLSADAMQLPCDAVKVCESVVAVVGSAGALSTSATEAARLAVKLSPSTWGVCVGVPKLRAKREGSLHAVRCEGAFGDGGELSVVVVAKGVELLGVGNCRCPS